MVRLRGSFLLILKNSMMTHITALFVFAAVAAVGGSAAALSIMGQDGLGYTGNITAAPIAGDVTMSIRPFPSSFTKGIDSFAGGVCDGSKIWMVPYDHASVVSLDMNSGDVVEYPGWPSGFFKGNYAFFGGVFDGTKLWMIPYFANDVVSVDVASGTKTLHETWPMGFSPPNYAFFGGTFDGSKVWMVPSKSPSVVSLDATAPHAMTAFSSWPTVGGFVKGVYAFAGGVFDGSNVWLIPSQASIVVSVAVGTGIMTGYDNWPIGLVRNVQGFVGGVFDGSKVWMIPYQAASVVSVDVAGGANDRARSLAFGIRQKWRRLPWRRV
jgi:hypothetical protein